MQRLSATIGIALVVCRNPVSGKYLSVYQRKQKWWLAGGRVEAPQSFTSAAKRECLQQTGINVDLKGILRIDEKKIPLYGLSRIKIIFYAEPVDPYQIPKQIADEQSIKAQYLTLPGIIRLRPKWRGQDFYNWNNYLQQKGKIFPLSVLKQLQD